MQPNQISDNSNNITIQQDQISDSIKRAIETILQTDKNYDYKKDLEEIKKNSEFIKSEKAKLSEKQKIIGEIRKSQENEIEKVKSELIKQSEILEKIKQNEKTPEHRGEKRYRSEHDDSGVKIRKLTEYTECEICALRGEHIRAKDCDKHITGKKLAYCEICKVYGHTADLCLFACKQYGICVPKALCKRHFHSQCMNCGLYNHREQQCNSRVCALCLKSGHMSVECPRRCGCVDYTVHHINSCRRGFGFMHLSKKVACDYRNCQGSACFAIYKIHNVSDEDLRCLFGNADNVHFSHFINLCVNHIPMQFKEAPWYKK